MKRLLSLIMSLAINAHATPANPARTLLDRYLMFKMPTDGSRKLPVELEPLHVLTKLSPWFEKGLAEATDFGGGFVGYELAEIPAPVLRELKRNTLSSNPRVSFAVLTGAFWTQVSDLQKKGLRVAVLANSETRKASGVFFREKNLIAFDILAEPGTLTHEFRHYLQSANFRFNEIPELLSERCVEDARRALGEIDATTDELSSYRGISSEFQTPANYPQVELFAINMFYPIEAGDYVNSDSDCPATLVDALRKIQSRIRGAVDNLNLLLWQLRKSVNQGAESSQIRQKFESALNDEIQARQPANSRILMQLQRDLRRDLCSQVPSFRFLSDCHEFLNQEEP